MKPFKSPRPEGAPAKEKSTKSDSDVNPILALHNCECKSQPGGYGHVVSACLEDQVGHLWLLGTQGRRMSKVNYCPFCGFQALNQASTLDTHEGPVEDVLTTPSDRPLRVWTRYAEPLKREHFLWGKVEVLASDGAHAKIRTVLHKAILTACVENLEAPAGIPVLPKVGKTKSTAKPPRDVEAEVKAAVQKYSHL